MICKCSKGYDIWGRYELDRDPLIELCEDMTIEEEIEKCKHLNQKYGDVNNCWYEVWKEPWYLNTNKVQIPGMIDKNGRTVN